MQIAGVVEGVCKKRGIRRMELLVRAGDDKTALDDKDHNPMVLILLQCLHPNLIHSLPQVFRALKHAPADRAWRPRGTHR